MYIYNKQCDLCTFMRKYTLILIGKLCAELKAFMVLSDFAIKQGSSHNSMEKAGLWAGRLSLKGRREVVLTHGPSLAEYMQKKGIVGIDAKTYFRDLRREGTQKAAI